ncbi:hypothetical protein AKJ16_DCAP24652, partial [Drosera capensis]
QAVGGTRLSGPVNRSAGRRGGFQNGLGQPVPGELNDDGDDKFSQLEGHDDDDIIDEVTKEEIHEQSIAESSVAKEPTAESLAVECPVAKPTPSESPVQ